MGVITTALSGTVLAARSTTPEEQNSTVGTRGAQDATSAGVCVDDDGAVDGRVAGTGGRRYRRLRARRHDGRRQLVADGRFECCRRPQAVERGLRMVDHQR